MNKCEKSAKRTKRTVLGRRAATPATPVPRWKQAFSDNQLDEARRVKATTPAAPSPSARKLAASLWELQDLPLPACLPACRYSPNWIPYNSSPPGAVPPPDVNASPFSQPDYILSPFSCKSASHRHLKKGAQRSVQTPLQRLLSRTAVEPGDDFARAPTPYLVDRQRHIRSPLFATTAKGEINGATKTSQELLKVFSQIRMLEEQHDASLNLTTALHTQLMEAHSRVRKLELPHRIARREVEGLMKRFSDEKMSWKIKEKERVRAAVQSVQEELEEERKTKQRVESANRRLTKELAKAQTAAAKAHQEIESERKALYMMEELCRELAQEMDNDKAEVDEVKRQSQQVREELEEERRMLQMAEVWREERVQMKLSEARLALETKSAALDDMRVELESFLSSRRDRRPYDTALRDAQALHNALTAVHYDTSISTFPPTSSMSSFPPTSECIHTATLDTDSSQGNRNGGHALPLYPKGIPDAD